MNTSSLRYYIYSIFSFLLVIFSFYFLELVNQQDKTSYLFILKYFISVLREKSNSAKYLLFKMYPRTKFLYTGKTFTINFEEIIQRFSRTRFLTVAKLIK